MDQLCSINSDPELKHGSCGDYRFSEEIPPPHHPGKFSHIPSYKGSWLFFSSRFLAFCHRLLSHLPCGRGLGFCLFPLMVTRAAVASELTYFSDFLLPRFASEGFFAASPAQRRARGDVFVLGDVFRCLEAGGQLSFAGPRSGRERRTRRPSCLIWLAQALGASSHSWTASLPGSGGRILETSLSSLSAAADGIPDLVQKPTHTLTKCSRGDQSCFSGENRQKLITE